MTPKQKLEEIERALRDASVLTASSTTTHAATLHAEVLRALTLARELREGAAEGCVDIDVTPSDCDGTDFWTHRPGIGMQPALLITGDDDDE